MATVAKDALVIVGDRGHGWLHDHPHAIVGVGVAGMCGFVGSLAALLAGAFSVRAFLACVASALLAFAAALLAGVVSDAT